MEHLELIATNKEEAYKNFSILVSHELTHFVHFQLIPEDKKIVGSMLDKLWTEGRATNASGEYFPEASMELILMDKNLAQECVPSKIQKFGQLFKKVLLSKDKKSNETWFLIREEVEEIPVRFGYCLGLKFAEYVAKSFKFEDLFKIAPKKIEELAPLYFSSLTQNLN